MKPSFTPPRAGSGARQSSPHLTPSRRCARLTGVILDKAPIHPSEAVSQGVERWLAKGVGVHFLPPYCPEFNQLKILWRNRK